MITVSKLAVAIAVAGPLAAATVCESPATPLPTGAVAAKAAASAAATDVQYRGMTTAPTLIAATEAIHIRTEATHTGTPPIPIGIPTPGILGMVIIEMTRPSTITGICKSDAKR